MGSTLAWPEGDGPLVIGVAGGSGSGKSTIVSALVEEVGTDRAVVIQHDAYYRDLSHLTFEERTKVNYDHPDSLETELLVRHLQELLDGSGVAIPTYDFSRHLRAEETRKVGPTEVVILEGILVLAEAELRQLMDLKIYVDTDADLRLARRLERDIGDRGRVPESVLVQYQDTVRPMHIQFVEPSKRHADIIIPEGYNPGAVGTMIRMLREYLG